MKNSRDLINYFIVEVMSCWDPKIWVSVKAQPRIPNQYPKCAEMSKDTELSEKKGRRGDDDLWTSPPSPKSHHRKAWQLLHSFLDGFIIQYIRFFVDLRDIMLKVISESASTVARHYRQGTLNWPMIIYISLAHVAAVIGIFTISKCHPATLLWAFILWPISGIGITGGVHRLWAHRSYKASFPLRVYLMLANSIANQGSIWHWSRDHRVHHKHSEVSLFMNESANNCIIMMIPILRLTPILTTLLEECSLLTWDGCL